MYADGQDQLFNSLQDLKSFTKIQILSLYAVPWELFEYERFCDIIKMRKKLGQLTAVEVQALDIMVDELSMGEGDMDIEEIFISLNNMEGITVETVPSRNFSS